jgi:hypothetical protein
MTVKDQFVMLPRELLESTAWRGRSVNAGRVIEFLMLEHMRHGGRENGNLKAPQRQLVAFGIGAQYVAGGINEVEQRRIVKAHRHGQRVATTYELTWLPLHDGSAPSDEWRQYQPPPKGRNLPNKRKAGLPYKGKADGSNLPYKGNAEPSENLPYKGKALYRSSYQGGADVSDLEGNAEAVGTGKPCTSYVTGPIGFRVCGKPSVGDGEHCPEHVRVQTAAGVSSGKLNGAAA